MENNLIKEDLEEDFSFIDNFKSENKSKSNVLKIVCKKDAYLLIAEENGEIIQKKVEKELSNLKQQFENIEKEVFLFWEDKSGNLHIRLKDEKNRNSHIELVDYEKYSNDVIFRMIVDKVQNGTKKKKKVVNQKRSNLRLIKRNAAFLAALTAAGIGYLVYAFGFSDDLEIIEPIVHIEAQPEDDRLENQEHKTAVETVIDQSLAMADTLKNPEVEAIPEVSNYEQARIYSNYLKEEATRENQESIMALYDQPLIPLELNIHMYKMAQKYDVSYQALVTISHVESDGNFTNHAVIGCTGDEGYMQINPQNYPVLCEELGYTPEQIKEDDKINIECAAFLLSDICKRNTRRNGSLNEDEMYREYNGGGNFKIIDATLEYLSKAKKAIADLYNLDHIIYVKDPEIMEVRK